MSRTLEISIRWLFWPRPSCFLQLGWTDSIEFHDVPLGLDQFQHQIEPSQDISSVHRKLKICQNLSESSNSVEKGKISVTLDWPTQIHSTNFGESQVDILQTVQLLSVALTPKNSWTAKSYIEQETSLGRRRSEVRHCLESLLESILSVCGFNFRGHWNYLLQARYLDSARISATPLQIYICTCIIHVRKDIENCNIHILVQIHVCT